MPAPLNPAAQISESLRSALSGTFASAESLSTAGTPPASVPSIHGNKSTSKGYHWRPFPESGSCTFTNDSVVERRLNGQPSIKLRAPTPVPMTGSTGYSGRGRPGRPKAQVEMEVEPELDAELEEEMDEEDLTLYCFCQKRSYGDVSSCRLFLVAQLLKGLPTQMIGCDNADCPYQWVTSISQIWFFCSALMKLQQFHIGCVGVKPPLPDKWYCPECSKQRNSSDRRKGRKMK